MKAEVGKKIGIIVHSQTDHTFSVAQFLQEKLSAKGHTVTVERVRPVDEQQTSAGAVELAESPDAAKYDALIFGAPVRGFNISPVIQTYLSRLPSLPDKRTACFVTMQLKFPWMGGRQAVSKMARLCESKGMAVAGTGIISWSSKNREQVIAECAADIVCLF